MSITDELRRIAAKTECANGRCEKLYRGDLDHIADRIDAAHERQLEVLYRDMSDAEYVELPVDADGVPIHVGDVMEWPDGKTFDVVGIGDGVLFYIENADGPADWTGASTKHHHKPPTVEDVLDEFASAYDCMECDCGYVADVADWAEWSYCPNCGAKVVDA